MKEVSTTMLGSQVQSLLEVTFSLNLFCSNTILADLPELSILGKSRMIFLINKTHASNNFYNVP